MKILYIIALSFCSIAIIHAQPNPCPSPAFMTPYCSQACILCDLDGFTGINSDTTKGETPPGFCTSWINHMQWIGFIAASVNLTVKVNVTNCLSYNGEGLEIGFYKGIDCKNYQLVSNCNTNIPVNTSALITNKVPLEIGQYYYVVMDGSAADICKYEFSVISGSTKAYPLTSSGSIIGPTKPCLGTKSNYSIKVPLSAVNIEWTFDGNKISTDSIISLNWQSPGDHQLCVNCSNICEKAPPSCIDIKVVEVKPTKIIKSLCEGDCLLIADTLLCKSGSYDIHTISTEGCDSMIHVDLKIIPHTDTTLNFKICQGESVTVAGIIYNKTGKYLKQINNWLGCDSTITLNLIVNPLSTNQLSYNICAGDSIVIGSNSYTQTGKYQLILTNWLGCDSIVNLDLKTIVCEIKGNVSSTPLKCFGDKNGKLDFTINTGTPPFKYTWELIGNTSVNGNGIINNLNEIISIPNLTEGEYVITIIDTFGNDVIIQAAVSSPEPLELTLQNSNYNSYNISCYGSTDGIIKTFVKGGTPPYSYLWKPGNFQSNTINNLPDGNYFVTVTDINNCVIENKTILIQPDSLAIQLSIVQPDCSSPSSGIINIDSVYGGVQPYNFNFNGINSTNTASYDKLIAGNYSFQVIDKNNCIKTINSILQNPLIPEIELGPDLTINLGEQIILHSYNNQFIDKYKWSFKDGLSCNDCPNPIASPFVNTTYILEAISPTSCIALDSINIQVIKNRRVYVPNAFSPNGDGINDKLTIFAGPEVLKIKSFNVFSRWGEHLFVQSDFPPNQLNYGWDGKARNKEMGPATFVWFAEIEFLDGEVILYKGDVNLIK